MNGIASRSRCIKSEQPYFFLRNLSETRVMLLFFKKLEKKASDTKIRVIIVLTMSNNDINNFFKDKSYGYGVLY